MPDAMADMVVILPWQLDQAAHIIAEDGEFLQSTKISCRQQMRYRCTVYLLHAAVLL